MQGYKVRRNFRESPKGEVRRIPLPRTPVNTPREEEARFGDRLKGNVCNEVGGVKRSADPRVGYETSDRIVKGHGARPPPRRAETLRRRQKKMATRMCDVCGIRPAVVAVRRVVPGEGQRVEHLCEIHAAEAGVGRSTLGGRSPLGGGSLFDDFFDRFFDEDPRGSPREETRGGGVVSRRQAEQVDITQFFNDSTTELLQRAAGQAVEWGNL